MKKFEPDILKIFQEIIEHGQNICSVCRHGLDLHFDEGDYWRCHSLGADFYQCECALRKDRAENNISFYDLSKRAKIQLEDIEKENKDIFDISKQN